MERRIVFRGGIVLDACQGYMFFGNYVRMTEDYLRIADGEKHSNANKDVGQSNRRAPPHSHHRINAVSHLSPRLLLNS